MMKSPQNSLKMVAFQTEDLFFGDRRKRENIAPSHRRSQGGRAPPIEMLPMIKTSQKILFLQCQFLLASSRAKVQVYNCN